MRGKESAVGEVYFPGKSEEISFEISVSSEEIFSIFGNTLNLAIFSHFSGLTRSSRGLEEMDNVP